VLDTQYLQLLRSFCSSGHGIVYSRNQEMIANIIDRHERHVKETHQIEQMVSWSCASLSFFFFFISLLSVDKFFFGYFFSGLLTIVILSSLRFLSDDQIKILKVEDDKEQRQVYHRMVFYYLPQDKFIRVDSIQTDADMQQTKNKEEMIDYISELLLLYYVVTEGMCSDMTSCIHLFMCCI
jgi:hypothetical protein